jgi:outer membrane protein assembly factor BamA
VLLAPVASAQTPILELRVEGNSRLPSAGIIAASGLKVGAVVTRHDLDAAAQKLVDTGFFHSANYRFQPKSSDRPGYVVTLQVSEEKAGRSVQLDIPGIEEAQLWATLRSMNGLIDKKMPDSEDCTAYYQHAIEAALEKSNQRVAIMMKSEVDLKTGEMVAIFRPVNLPLVSDIRFERNQRILAPALTAAVSGLVLHQEYSERVVRQIVDLNLKPLYEEKGLLTVAFPSVTIAKNADGTVAVTVAVDEGKVWTLGKVDVSGDELPLDAMREAAKFPEGKLANWKQVTAGIDAMKKVLHTDGYLAVSAKLERTYRKDAGVVDLAVQVKKGQQFLFGSLQLNGLSGDVEKQLRPAWKLREGDPMNDLYFLEFLRAIRGGPVKDMRVGQTLNLRPGTNVIDVIITFK